MRVSLAASATVSAQAYWAEQASDLLHSLGSSPVGLSETEAAARLRVRRRSLGEGRGQSMTAKLALRQFQNPLVLILVLASLISMVLRDWIEAAVVLSIVLVSTVLAFTQEFTAHRTFERLASRVRVQSVVLRSGRERHVLVDQLVPGDVLVLSPGCLVTADAVLLWANRLLVNQASLTGESYPVIKQPGISAPDAALGDRNNCVFMGSSVESGHAHALVVQSGSGTIFGRITERLAMTAGPTEFEQGVQRFGQMLLQTMLIVVLYVLVINLLQEKPSMDILMFALALSVGLTPELLPAIVSVMLAHGARHLARHGVIVRKLNAIESLGGMTVLCTDKTGTLTVGAAALHAAYDANGGGSEDVLRLAMLNATFQSGQANPIDQAIVSAAKQAGLSTAGAVKLGEIPLDFDRKCVSVLVQGDQVGSRLITKGAVDQLLLRCDSVGRPDEPLTDSHRQVLLTRHRHWAAQGLRVLGVAIREVASLKEDGLLAEERHLCLIGFLVFADPPKSDSKRMIRALEDRGVAIKIITGDDDHVARFTAEAVGLPCHRIVTGAELDRLNDQALAEAVAQAHVFAEVDPHQKERIVRVLQRTGAVVGFLGDGVNDALALHTADVGISVSNAGDVAREAADFVLLKKELRLICDGIDEGRRTFANTMKYVLSTTSANFGNMISMGVISGFLPFLPLLPSQVLLNNLLSDIPAMALAGDRSDRLWIERPRRFDTTFIRNYMVLFGLVSAAFDLLLFAFLLWGMSLTVEQFRTAWFIESLLTELAVLLVIRSMMPCWKSRPSALLLGLTVGVAVFALILPYSPAAAWFELVPMPAWLTASIVLLTLVYAFTVEVLKRRLMARARWGTVDDRLAPQSTSSSSGSLI